MGKLLLITTGGTIACPDVNEGRSPTATAQSLLEKLSEIPQNCEISAISPFSLDSTNMTPRHWSRLAKIICENYVGFDGFVITHGTDTLGYAAAALSCLIQGGEKPVVLTGSMFPMEAEGSDARGNLQNALFFASDMAHIKRGGVCVVFGGFAYDGRCVCKIHSTAANAFESVNYPPIARFDERGITYTEGVSRIAGRAANSKARFYDSLDGRLEVVFLVPGVKPPLIREDTRAVIVRGFGTGGLPESGEYDEWLAGLISRGVMVIMGTQVLRGGSDLSVYEVGSRLSQQVIDAGAKSIEYAAMKAMWALANSDNASEFRKKFLNEFDE